MFRGLHYNLINLVLTEDQLDRPISDLEDEMSEATNMRVVSFAQDLIYDVTRCKVQTPEHVGLAVQKYALCVFLHSVFCRW
jgi:hypothetical protein